MQPGVGACSKSTAPDQSAVSSIGSTRPACSRGAAGSSRIDASDALIMLLRRFRSSDSVAGRMNGMVDSPDALGDDPCTVTGIRAINEPGEGLVELEITVGCSRASPWKDHPAEHPWFREFHHRVRLGWNQGQMGIDPYGRISFDVPRGQLEDFIRAVRQAVRDTDAEHQASMARYREYARGQAQARREAQADLAKRARLAEDQARIDAVLAETG
jgi:hypothetical protein